MNINATSESSQGARTDRPRRAVTADRAWEHGTVRYSFAELARNLAAAGITDAEMNSRYFSTLEHAMQKFERSINVSFERAAAGTHSE